MSGRSGDGEEISAVVLLQHRGESEAEDGISGFGNASRAERAEGVPAVLLVQLAPQDKAKASGLRGEGRFLPAASIADAEQRAVQIPFGGTHQLFTSIEKFTSLARKYG